ncbi:ABC transporter permease [Cohnella sp. GCM10027633]|uniref:ABC transporter permease n=1 Tax=unclassified Cohnella TaxID=2636738 RepID=UPI003642001B
MSELNRNPANRTTNALLELRTAIRPQRPGKASAIGSFVWRAWKRTMSMIGYLAIDVVIFPVIFLLIFTYLFGGAISGSSDEYLRFLLPGMLIYTVTTMTIYIGISIKTDLDRGVFNRFRTLPFWQPAAIIGNVVVNVATYAAAIVTTLLMGMLLGFRPDAGAAGAVLGIVFAVFYAFSISWIFACIGIVAKKTESINGMSYIVLYPLLFTSNVFVDTDTMPDWLGGIVAYNPISLASTAARGIMHGTASDGDLYRAIGFLAACMAVFMTLAFRLYRNKAK